MKFDIFAHIYQSTLKVYLKFMTININYLGSANEKSSSNIVLFSNEKFNIDNQKKYLSETEFSYIKDLLKTYDLKKNLFVFEVTSKKKVILISIKKQS